MNRHPNEICEDCGKDKAYIDYGDDFSWECFNCKILVDKKKTWDQVLNEHWRQFNLACQSMNQAKNMPEINWREYVLYDLCKKHNEETGKQYFKFDDSLKVC